MNKTILGLALAIAMSAQAQETTTAAPAPAAAAEAVPEGTVETQTSTTTVADAAPAPAKKWSGMALVETIAGVGSLKKDGGESLMTQYGSIGGGYKITDTVTVGARYNFTNYLISDKEQLAIKKDNVVTGYKDQYVSDDPTLHVSAKTKARVLGSEPYTFSARYYVPVSEASQDNKRNGTFRTDNVLTWTLNPKVSIDAYLGVRLYLNQDDPTLGADSRLRSDLGPQVNYNFTDKLSVYYMPFLHTVSRGYQRGDWKADLTNKIYQDIGLNWTVGAITLNPYWETGADLNNGKGMGSDATSIYSLVVSGAF